MRSFRPHRPSHALVVAYAALFVASSGTAYAAATIGSADVVDESLKSVDLKNGAAVRSEDVVNDSVAGGGLTGKDIREDTLVMPTPEVGVMGDSRQARLGYESRDIPALTAAPAVLGVGHIGADYRCPDFPAENDGTLYLTVEGPGDLFLDQGQPNPTYIRVSAQGLQTQLVVPAAGDAITIQYERDADASGQKDLSTLLISVVGRPGLTGVNHGTCHLQAQIFDSVGE